MCSEPDKVIFTHENLHFSNNYNSLYIRYNDI